MEGLLHEDEMLEKAGNRWIGAESFPELPNGATAR